MRAMLLAAFGAVALTNSVAAEPQWIAGIGNLQCGEVLEMMDSGGVQLAFTSWAAGYVTGVNTAAAVDRGYVFSVHGLRAADLLAPAITYCAAAPSSLFVEAVDNVLRNLPREPW